MSSASSGLAFALQAQAGIRQFDTGATRNPDADKYDYEGFIDPVVLERYAKYMHHHRRMADGSLRDSDNWQKGIPIPQYMKSLLRHVVDLWKVHRGHAVFESGAPTTAEDLLCAVIFNAMGYLHELLKQRSPIIVNQAPTFGLPVGALGTGGVIHRVQ